MLNDDLMRLWGSSLRIGLAMLKGSLKEGDGWALPRLASAVSVEPEVAWLIRMVWVSAFAL
jgi:hypothetical protein